MDDRGMDQPQQVVWRDYGHSPFAAVGLLENWHFQKKQHFLVSFIKPDCYFHQMQPLRELVLWKYTAETNKVLNWDLYTPAPATTESKTDTHI